MRPAAIAAMEADSSDWVPRFPDAVIFRFDKRRARWVLLAPERVLLPDEEGVAVLRLVDGTRSVAAIAGELSRCYGAPLDVVAEDVTAFLQDLAARGMLAR